MVQNFNNSGLLNKIKEYSESAIYDIHKCWIDGPISVYIIYEKSKYKYIIRCSLSTEYHSLTNILMDFPLYLDIAIVSITGEEFPEDIINIEDKKKMLMLMGSELFKNRNFTNELNDIFTIGNSKVRNVVYNAQKNVTGIVRRLINGN